MFQYEDGPNSGYSGLPGAPTYSGDTTTFSGFVAKNFSNHALADVGVWSPFLWVKLSDGTREALTWDNTQHGWYTPNFVSDNGPTGESLLLTARFSSDSTQVVNRPLRAGNVADIEGKAQYPLNSGDLGVPFPQEAIKPNDLLPFGDLGSFAAGQEKSFSLSLTAHWGGTDLGPIAHADGVAPTVEPFNTNRVGGPHFGDTLFSG
jgi:hypothetical protein